MRVTEVTVRPATDADRGKVLAYCSVVLDGEFVVRDVKVLRPHGGRPPLVAMPNRPVTDRCPQCSHRTPYMDSYCGRCGTHLPAKRPLPPHVQETGDLFMDVCYPATAEFRAHVTRAVLGAFLSGAGASSGGFYVHTA